MKKESTFKKFASAELKEKNEIKGGLRAAPSWSGGSGGAGWIDWGDIDIRNDFGSVIIMKNNKLSSLDLG